jgi:hypothetical protein
LQDWVDNAIVKVQQLLLAAVAGLYGTLHEGCQHVVTKQKHCDAVLFAKADLAVQAYDLPHDYASRGCCPCTVTLPYLHSSQHVLLQLLHHSQLLPHPKSALVLHHSLQLRLHS